MKFKSAADTYTPTLKNLRRELKDLAESIAFYSDGSTVESQEYAKGYDLLFRRSHKQAAIIRLAIETLERRGEEMKTKPNENSSLASAPKRPLTSAEESVVEGETPKNAK